jgi:hypothetical protein
MVASCPGRPFISRSIRLTKTGWFVRLEEAILGVDATEGLCSSLFGTEKVGRVWKNMNEWTY